MPRTASPATCPAPPAPDADGEEFPLDFGMPTVSTAKPRATPDMDPVELALAREVESAPYRAEALQAKGRLP